MSTATKTKKVKPAGVRYRTKCPACGYGLAMGDSGRDEIHCASCHQTSAIPSPKTMQKIPDVEIVSSMIEAQTKFLLSIAVAGRRSPTEFDVEYEGRLFSVTVAPVQ